MPLFMLKVFPGFFKYFSLNLFCFCKVDLIFLWKVILVKLFMIDKSFVCQQFRADKQSISGPAGNRAVWGRCLSLFCWIEWQKLPIILPAVMQKISNFFSPQALSHLFRMETAMTKCAIKHLLHVYFQS